MGKLNHIKETLTRLLEEIKNGNTIFSLPDETIDSHPIFKKYFGRIFGENNKLDAQVEKALSAAVITFSMQKMNMSKEEALQAARQSVEFLREVRSKKILQDGKVTEEAYDMYHRLIHSSWLRAAIKTQCKRAKCKMKIAWKLLYKVPKLNKVLPIVENVWSMIPAEVKEGAKKKAKELAEEAAEIVPEILVPIVEKGYEFGRKIVETIHVGLEKAKENGREFVENHPMFKPVYEMTKMIVERIPTPVRNFSSKLLNFFGVR